MLVVVHVAEAKDLESNKMFRHVNHAYVNLYYARKKITSDVAHKQKNAPRWGLKKRFANINPARDSTIRIDVFDQGQWGRSEMFIGYCEVAVPVRPKRVDFWVPIKVEDATTGSVLVHIDCIAEPSEILPRSQRDLDYAMPPRQVAPYLLPMPPPQVAPYQLPMRRMGSLSDSFLQLAAALPETVPRIEPTELCTCDHLGSGAFGNVHSGSYKDLTVAVKTFHIKCGDEIETFKKEVNVMAGLDSTHTVQLLGISHAANDQPQIVMEFMDGGNLDMHIKSLAAAREHNVSKVLHLACGIVKGLAYLHANKIIHRDLKPANVLLSADKTVVKLGDFGISREEDVKESMTNGVGTTLWMSPEVMQGGRYSVAADMYAFGVILTELETLRTPYAGLNLRKYALQDKIAKEGLRPTTSATCPPWYARLAQDCMQANPDKRPSAVDVVGILEAHMSSPPCFQLIPEALLRDIVPFTSSKSSVLGRATLACRPVVLKTFPSMNPDVFEDTVDVMRAVASPHTVPLLGTTSLSSTAIMGLASPCVLVLAYMPGGNLHKWLTQRSNVDFLDTARTITEALAYLHAKKVVHGNLTPSNVLFDAVGQPKLTDFGYERDEDMMTTNGGNATHWMAPEIFHGSLPSSASDVYSLGVILTQLETGREPYWDFIGNLQRRVVQIVTGALRPSLSALCPPWYRKLAQACMAGDAMHRPSAAEIVSELVKHTAKP
ncbi:serine/threonine protein kinase [Saprolegnia parasitica CBS 223.65]|uniref:Serine/threonine protein kinase n=1 Tax=Saprolegnia parasitica (strain CBS 223.65) TaxID=695850 RepID=A0A067BM37_SAPPC|nr:serine/threonine protein kinase [Saprolegnia parasitica CBS 223.65]KDO19248.1 serine/threonine protein kinase [Saprolegnia parasitica CBS 223.65]|eukprot:XP_012210053.1 serine/threonine protein kinase [Saprolegnia parasitica CBS 223.65]